MGDTSRFYFNTSGPDDDAVAAGWKWLFRETAQSSKKVGWVAANGVQVASRMNRAIGDMATALARDRVVTGGGISIGLITETRAKAAPWVSGPLLAVWPSSRLLSRIEDDLHPPALCVIPWVPGELDAWIAGHNPTDLRTGKTDTATPAISNPVVAAALTSLTQTIDMGTGQVDLTDFRDRAAAIQAFRILLDGHEDLEPSQIAPWAIANGWDMAAARELQEIAEKTRSGMRLRGSPQAGRRWATDALQQWRRAASEDD
jgi:hypothetical protein